MKPFKIYVFTFLNHNCFIVVCSLAPELGQLGKYPQFQVHQSLN